MLHCTDCVRVGVLFESVDDNWLELSVEEFCRVDVSSAERDGGVDD